MAVEIKELIIRAQVNYPSANTVAGKSEPTDSSSSLPDDAIVQACVKQVLKILKQQQKR